MKILVVDDNPNDRYMLKLNLEHHGCEVIEAQDGNEGFAKALERMPDIIISDGLMPVMDGFQFLKKIRGNETTKSIPFVFYSAVYTDHDEINLAVSLGADAFIIKPKEPEVFWQELSGIPEESRLKKAKARTGELVLAEEEFLKKYSVVVAAKLEEKVAELLRQKSLFSTIIESTTDAIFLKDIAGKYHAINETGARMLGYKAADVIGRTDRELLPADTAAEFRKTDEQVMSSNQVYEREESGLIGGETRIFLAHKTPWRSDSGEIIGVVGISSDITERKRAEETQRETQRKMTTLLNNLPGMTYRCRNDKEWTTEFVSDGCFALTGYHPTELIGNLLVSYASLIQAEDRELVWEAVQKSIREKKRFTINYRIQTRDGAIKWVWEQGQGIFSEKGELVALEGFISDITEHHKLEEQLRHAQKMEAIGTLAGGIAHDFNNMLSVILGYGAMMHDKTEAGSPLREQLNEVLEAADRAATLTRRLLVFSRKQAVNVKPVNINETIADIRKMLVRVIGEDIDLQINLMNNELTVMADSAQLEQVLMNLAVNARDAMPKGGKLTIETKIVSSSKLGVWSSERIHEGFNSELRTQYSEPADFAEISVKDTGAGMDAETQARIFEPFFTTKGIGAGTGLGLSISYQIIKQHNGYIECYSEAGKSTMFKIYLPLIAGTALLDRKAEDADAAKGGTETILVAEDDPSLRKMAVTVLESFGYTVIPAEDGEVAVRKFTENSDRIKLVILDLVMPKKSGKEAYEEINKIKPGTKTFFTSGYTMDMISRMEIEKGLEVIIKPVTPKDLLRKVRELLDR